MSMNQDGQKLFFVTGKGGVGKSLVSAALAHKFVKQGYRTLLLELGDKSFFRHFFQVPSQENKFTLANGVELQLLEGEAVLREYVLHYVKFSKIVDLFFENPVSKSLVKVAPGLKELAIMGKITSGIRHIGPPFEYDRVVVDGYATGHFMALIKAPRGMYEAIQFGPMGIQSKSIMEVLGDNKLCHFYVVSLAEEMAIKEAIELRSQIYTETNQSSRLLLNQILPKNLVNVVDKELQKQSSEFLTFIHERAVSQSENIKQLESEGTQYSQIDFIYENDPNILVEMAAQQLEEIG